MTSSSVDQLPFKGSATSFSGPFVHDLGYAWHVDLPNDFATFSDNLENPRRSNLLLLEDGKTIGEAHQIHSKIRQLGQGRFSHWLSGLYFSTSDNTDPNVNGRIYSVQIGRPQPLEDVSTKQKLTVDGSLLELFKRRNIKNVVYFHTDHFEPWSAKTGEARRQALRRFIDLSSKSRYGRKLSLFYTPLIAASLRGGEVLQNSYSVPGDGVVFQYARAEYADLFTELAAHHEFHVHIHHERWTQNTGDFESDVSRWVKRNSSEALDANRFDLFVQLTLFAIREETKKPLHSWAFVHGNWALNGSDATICTLKDEIEILMKHGCYGDFTFPAGRSHCNPTHAKFPYTCEPVRAIRGYDLPESNIETVDARRPNFPSDRFFIWNSHIQAKHSSLDLYYEPNCRLISEPDALIRVWLEQSVVLDSQLYLKTHAHSMDSSYSLWQNGSCTPHAHPDVVRLFERLEEVCAAAGVSFELATADEVMSKLNPVSSSVGQVGNTKPSHGH